MSNARLQVYEPPMCCSSGACGPEVDPELLRFACDLDWLNRQGVAVERFSLSQQPAEFARQQCVRNALAADGSSCLPLVVANGEIVSRGQYPSRKAMAAFAGIVSEHY